MGTLAGHLYLSRAEWGARAPKGEFIRMPSLPTGRLYVHHTATEQHGVAGIREIQLYHQNSKGWKDIAYSFLIDDDGTIYEGRGAGIIGGATAGENSTSHAICLMGNFENREPSEPAFVSLTDLARHGEQVGWWTPTCHGHRDSAGASTACPGRHLYARLPELRREIDQPPAPKEEDMPLSDAEFNRLNLLMVAAAWGAAQRLGAYLATGRGNAAFNPTEQTWMAESETITLPRLMAASKGLEADVASIDVDADIDIDEAAIVAGLLSTLTPQAIADAISDSVAVDVVELLSARLAA